MSIHPLKQAFRRIAALLILALLALNALPALAENSFPAVVAVDAMSVYGKDEPHALLGTLPRGTQVTVEAWSGNVALIRYKGNVGLARVSDMTAATTEQEPETEPETETETETGKTVVALRSTRIYRRPSTSSAYVTVEAGASMTLLAVNGSCAKVQRNGSVGYAVYSHLGEPGSQTQTEEETETTASKLPTASAGTQASSSATASRALMSLRCMYRLFMTKHSPLA